MNTQLIFRADASARLGVGHLMRCLALAQGWKARGGKAVFITACETEALRHRLQDEGFQVFILEQSYPEPADWEITSEVLAAHSDNWVVLDGYNFDSTYQRQIKDLGHRLLVIDDRAHLGKYYCDIVLNQNTYAKNLHYSSGLTPHLLLGPRYALLRQGFLSWIDYKREIPKIALRVLITLGGGDPNNQTLVFIRALEQMDVDALEVAVVVGPAYPHFHTLQSAVKHSKLPIRLVYNADNMPELMAWADLAISAGGSTCLEMSFMGLPALVVILAENQRAVAEDLEVAIGRGSVNVQTVAVPAGCGSHVQVGGVTVHHRQQEV